MVPENDHQLKVPVGWIDSWYKITPTQKPLSALCTVHWTAFWDLAVMNQNEPVDPW